MYKVLYSVDVSKRSPDSAFQIADCPAGHMAKRVCPALQWYDVGRHLNGWIRQEAASSAFHDTLP